MPTPRAIGRSPSPFNQRRSASLTWTTDTSLNAIGPPRQRPSRMTLRPALVDPQGGPMTGNRGGPIPLAKPAVTWSHAAGKRHSGLGCRTCDPEGPPARPGRGKALRETPNRRGLGGKIRIWGSTRRRRGSSTATHSGSSTTCRSTRWARLLASSKRCRGRSTHGTFRDVPPGYQ